MWLFRGELGTRGRLNEAGVKPKWLSSDVVAFWGVLPSVDGYEKLEPPPVLLKQTSIVFPVSRRVYRLAQCRACRNLRGCRPRMHERAPTHSLHKPPRVAQSSNTIPIYTAKKMTSTPSQLMPGSIYIVKTDHTIPANCRDLTQAPHANSVKLLKTLSKMVFSTSSIIHHK